MAAEICTTATRRLPTSGGPAPNTTRSGSGSGGPPPAAGFNLHGYNQREEEQAVEEHAKTDYGSPLDLPRADYCNSSELSTGAGLSNQP